MGCAARIRIGSLAIFAALGIGAEPARADVSAYTLEKLVLEGDPDPVAGTLTQMSSDFDFDTSGRAVVSGYVWDDPLSTEKIFSIEGGELTTEVTQGDPVPGSAGLTFLSIGKPRIAAPGTLAYLGIIDVDEFGPQLGGFLRHDGVDSAIVVSGAAAPGGGTIGRIFPIHAATSAPSVALAAEVDTGGPSPIDALFVHDAAGLREIAREGQAAPAAMGGTFSGLSAWSPALQPDGSVIFYAEVSGGSAGSGFFEATPTGVTTPVMLAGDAVTTPGGGHFESFFGIVVGNAEGDLILAPFVMRPPFGFPQQSIFVIEAGVQREVVFRGDPIPGTNPARFYRQLAGNDPLALNRAGDLAFVGVLEDVLGNYSERALLVDIGDGVEILAREGDPVPGVAGAIFTDFPKVRMNDDGTIAFLAYTTAGIGVFRATRPAVVPTMPPLALALLAGLLGIGGAWGQRRTR